MDPQELRKVAGDLALYVIENRLIDEQQEGEWWLLDLGATVALEADERGYANAAEIAEEAVRQYREKAGRED